MAFRSHLESQTAQTSSRKVAWRVLLNSDLAVLYIIYGLKYQNYEREHHSGDSCENAA